jgi:DNA-binding transcriptional MerR regulator
MAETLVKIGEVADLLATSVRTIRYYEEEGLVVPVRSAGGTRLYTRRHVERLRAVLRLTREGYSIELIKALATARERCRTGDESRKAVGGQLDEILAGIDAQLVRLHALRAQIDAARETVGGCAGCANPPTGQGCPHCPVRKRLEDIELLNLVWD